LSVTLPGHIYKILSEPAAVCRQCVKDILVCFFVHSFNCCSLTKRER